MKGASLLLLAGAVFAATGVEAQKRIEADQPYAAIARQAGRVGPPRWRLPLGAVWVDQLQQVDADHLLVGTREDEIRVGNLEFLLVRCDDGSVVWRVKRPRSGTSTVLALDDDGILFQTSDDDKATFNAVALADGKERWERSYKADAVTGHPAPWADRVLVEERRKEKVELKAIGWENGEEAWSLSYEIPRDEWRHPPVVTPAATLVFSEGTARLDEEDGKVLWRRPDLAPAESGAPVQMDDSLAYLTLDHAVEAVALADGKTRWRTALPAFAAITNVLPDSGAVYLRGIVERQAAGSVRGSGVFLFSLLDPADGTIRWQRRTVRPTLSNVVALQGGIYVAGVDRLYGFEAANGDLRLEEETGTTRPYPIRLRAYPDRIGFIGEHVLASFDPETGERLVWVGTTPLSEVTTLAGLDAQIPRLKAEIGRAGSSRSTGTGFSYASYASAEANRYQNMANQYGRDYWTARSSGDPLRAQSAASRQRSASAHSKTMSKVAMAASIFEVALAFRQGMMKADVAKTEGMLERQLMFRESVLSGNAGAETGDWVYRPNKVFLGGESFGSVAMLNLATGQRRIAVVSADYEGHGLWNVLDPERGVIYHAGIGLDTAAYTWSKSHSAWPEGKVETIEINLLATPVRLPASP